MGSPTSKKMTLSIHIYNTPDIRYANFQQKISTKISTFIVEKWEMFEAFLSSYLMKIFVENWHM